MHIFYFMYNVMHIYNLMTFLTGKIPNPDFFQTSVSLYLLLCSLTLMRNHLMRGWSKFLNLYLIPVVYLYNKKFKSRNHGLSRIFYQSLKWTANLKKGPILLLTLLAAEGHLYLLSHLSVSFWDQMIWPKAVAGFSVQCLSCCHRLCCLLFCGHLSTFYMELKY